jgi:hypothetical protein
MCFFYRTPLHVNLPVAEAAHAHIGVQVVRQVVVRGRAQHADARARDELPQVERQHSRQRPVEDRGELVG